MDGETLQKLLRDKFGRGGQAQLAATLNVSPRTVARWCRFGVHKRSNIDQIKAAVMSADGKDGALRTLFDALALIDQANALIRRAVLEVEISRAGGGEARQEAPAKPAEATGGAKPKQPREELGALVKTLTLDDNETPELPRAAFLLACDKVFAWAGDVEGPAKLREDLKSLPGMTQEMGWDRATLARDKTLAGRVLAVVKGWTGDCALIDVAAPLAGAYGDMSAADYVYLLRAAFGKLGLLHAGYEIQIPAAGDWLQIKKGA